MTRADEAPHTGTVNPYDALLEECKYDSAQLEQYYAHRRLSQYRLQRELFLSDNFEGLVIDPILRDLVAESARPLSEKTGYHDPRNCLVLWVRPPERVKLLVKQCQERLLAVLPNMWCMPQDNLHMTALELVHSRTPEELQALVDSVPLALVERVTTLPNLLAAGVDTPPRFARLHRPALVFDAKGIALTYLPVPAARGGEADFSYHELRSKLYSDFTTQGVEVASRYVNPSAHITIGRFISEEDTTLQSPDLKSKDLDRTRIADLLKALDEVNKLLETEYLGDNGLWIVGEGKGLDFRRGTLWYGGGVTISQGPPL